MLSQKELDELRGQDDLTATEKDLLDTITDLTKRLEASEGKLECAKCHLAVPCSLIPLDTQAHEPLCPRCISLMLGEADQLMQETTRQLAELREREKAQIAAAYEKVAKAVEPSEAKLAALIRSLTDADAKAALDAQIASAEAKGRRDALDRVANHYAYLSDKMKKENRAFGIYDDVSNTATQWANAERADLEKQKATAK